MDEKRSSEIEVEPLELPVSGMGLEDLEEVECVCGCDREANDSWPDSLTSFNSPDLIARLAPPAETAH
ncbi:MAG: hypothetical protein ACAH17_01970, partial [Candidatus Paceibacterota bacterium]